MLGRNEEKDLLILLQITECSNKSCTICRHNLERNPRCTRIMRTQIVTQPADRKRTITEHKRDEKSADIPDSGVWTAELNGIPDTGNSRPENEERAAYAVFVTQISGDQAHDEAYHIRRYGKELGLNGFVTEAMDNSGKE
jgi:hypothetical protein